MSLSHFLPIFIFICSITFFTGRVETVYKKTLKFFNLAIKKSKLNLRQKLSVTYGSTKTFEVRYF